MAKVNFYSKAINRIIKFLGYVVGVLLMGTLVMVILQVFTRYVLRNPISWTEQASRYMFVWMMMLGLPIMFNSGNTMAFDLILERLPKAGNKIVSAFFRLFTLAFCAFWCYSSIIYTLEHGTKLASGIRIPMACVYSAQAFGSALIVLVMIKQFIELCSKKKGEEK